MPLNYTNNFFMFPIRHVLPLLQYWSTGRTLAGFVNKLLKGTNRQNSCRFELFLGTKT